MRQFENLAYRLASDPGFRATFAIDPGAGWLALNDAEHQLLESLQPLLARSPRDLLATLLGQGGGPWWDWPIAPFSLSEGAQ